MIFTGPTHTNRERILQGMYMKGQDSWRPSWNSGYHTISIFAYLTPNYITFYLITEYHPKYELDENPIYFYQKYLQNTFSRRNHVCGPDQHEGRIISTYVEWLKECHMTISALKCLPMIEIKPDINFNNVILLDLSLDIAQLIVNRSRSRSWLGCVRER